MLQDGFSLIELMVVVAIIGVLAAIAIPQLDGFRQKARASEARTSLGSLYTAEKAFFYEGGKYSQDLNAIGYVISGQDRSYAVGFDGAVVCGGSATCNVWASTRGTPIVIGGTACEVNATGTEFLAGAFGDNTSLGDSYDGFQINHEKNLSDKSYATGTPGLTNNCAS